MSTGARRTLILVIIGVVFVVGVTISVVRNLSKERSVTINAKVLKLDLAARTATIEFTHPKTGKAMPVDGHVPLTCDIQIDGKPARLEDVRVGDQGQVQATVSGLGCTAEWIRVTRESTTANSAPTASSPAPAASQATKAP